MMTGSKIKIMRKNEIFLSLSESEDLVFKKNLLIPESRLNINQRQKDLSIIVKLNIEDVRIFDGEVVLFSGDISSFEIPEKERKLFVYHLKVPEGMIETVTRNYRDSKPKKNQGELPYTEESEKERLRNQFTFLRRSLFYCFTLGQSGGISDNFKDAIFGLINQIRSLSNFKTQFLKELVVQEGYPIKEINDGKFHPDAQKRFVWLGGYLFNVDTKIKKDRKEEEIKTAKKWFMQFKDKEDVDLIKKALKGIPELFKTEFPFIFGYYIAASFYDEILDDPNFVQILNKKVEAYGRKEDGQLLLWTIFFHALFQKNMDYLYPIPFLQP